MSSAPATEFSRFLNLPYEIRWKIYEFCLPSRVIDSEIRDLCEVPESLFKEHALAARYIVAKFSRTPVIAKASAEVYRVVRQHLVAPPANEWIWKWASDTDAGGFNEVGYADSRPIYFNPRSDVLVVSLGGDWALGEKIQQPVKTSPHWLAKSPDVVLALDEETLSYLVGWKTLANYCFLGRKDCTIILGETRLIRPVDWIVSCGLFGLFGEERTVLVDVDDLDLIDYVDKKLNGENIHLSEWRWCRMAPGIPPGGIRRYSSHSNVDCKDAWDEDSPLTSTEERTQIIAKDKKDAISMIRQSWLGVNGCFHDREPEDPCFVPSAGDVWVGDFDEEHPNAKPWYEKLPAFSFAVRVNVRDTEECTRLIRAEEVREEAEELAFQQWCEKYGSE